MRFQIWCKKEFSPVSDDNPPRGPSGIGNAAIENETSRSLLWSLSVSLSLSSSNVSMTGGGCEIVHLKGL